MHITKEDYASATGVSEVTVWRRLKGVPFRVPRKRSEKLYPLAGVLPSLKQKEVDSGAVERLAQAAQRPNRDMYVEAEALPIAEAFVSFLGRMPTAEAKERARAVRNQFVVAVAHSPLCHGPTVVANLEALKMLFMLHASVTRWIILGGKPPDVAGMAPAFAVANNCAELDAHEVAA